jgi:hypothetical protein
MTTCCLATCQQCQQVRLLLLLGLLLQCQLPLCCVQLLQCIPGSKVTQAACKLLRCRPKLLLLLALLLHKQARCRCLLWSGTSPHCRVAQVQPLA